MSDNHHDQKAEPKSGFVLLTIFKDENERAVIQRSHQRQCDNYDDVWDEAKSQMGKIRELAKPDKDQKAPPTDLSIYLEGDDVTYVIELHPKTRAAFGPGPHPIMIMPSMLGQELLSELALVYKDSSGTIVRVTQNNIPHQYSAVPRNAALSFRCSLSKMRAAWTENVTNAGHYEENIRIPFFLNLFDRKTGKPVWTYGPEYHRRDHQQEHDDPKNKGKEEYRVHGGIHPDTVTQFFYYP